MFLHINPQVATSELQSLLARLPELLKQSEVIAARSDVVYHLNVGAHSWAIKHYKPISWLKSQIYRILGSPAKRSFKAACYLQQRAVGTPLPIAYAEDSQHSRLKATYFICQFLENRIDFRAYLKLDPAVTAVVAQAIRHMHEARSEEHTSELQSRLQLLSPLLLSKKI